ncbi:MAG: putative toxin-antitoxin system toxin component, PIN family [Actinobacteria bacterium]|nr:putative toxin-antitoxin system toxin component, PIN family [Actinomycetota bacterium]
MLDTNVFVSAAIQNGASHQIVHHLIRDHSDELIICDEILYEIRDVLVSRPRLRKWISLNDAERYVEMLQLRFNFVPNPTDIIPLSRDSDDDYILALAQRERADYVISGDKDLLVLHFPEFSIVTPAEFATILKTND